MFKTNTIFILLGSNIEPRAEYINRATDLIGEHIGNVVLYSSLYETEAVGFHSETDFINTIVCCNTEMDEDGVLSSALSIENELGRSREGKGYSSRTIDIDILYFNEKIIDRDGLTIPHPRLHERRFTLLPLCEIAPEFVHPVFNKTNKVLLDECADMSKVIRI